MNKSIFTVYDAKVEAYLDPFFARTVGEALRSFTQVVNKEGHPFNVAPEDYTLFKVGEFDAETGLITATPGVLSVANAVELVAQPRLHLEE